MAGKVLSNVIGAPFDEYIMKQLQVRSANNSSDTRTPEQVLYLANKMSWTRLTSSVRVQKGADGKFWSNLFDGQPLPEYLMNNADETSLAKNWILEAGTSRVMNNQLSLRYGLGTDGSYGLGGIGEQGYRPMPGIESVTIDTKGTLGSLREASINFKVWNVVQLNIMEALYFRLGYTMLLEWGHVNYFDNSGKFQASSVDNTPLDIFDKTKFNGKEDIQQAVYERNKTANGNYDGMLGTVTNFYFSFNQEGGFDCNIKLIGLGTVLDTVRINQTFSMPKVLASKLKTQAALLDERNKQIAAEVAAAADIQARKKDKLLTVHPGEVKNLDGIKELYKIVNGTLPDNTWVNRISFQAIQSSNASAATITDYFYKVDNATTVINNELNVGDNKNPPRAGLFLNHANGWQFIPAGVANNPQPVKLNIGLIRDLAEPSRQGLTDAVANSKFDTEAYLPYTTEKGTIKIYPKEDTSFFNPDRLLSDPDLGPLKRGSIGGLWDTPTTELASTTIVGLLDTSLNQYNQGFTKKNREYFSSTIKKSAIVDTPFSMYILYALNGQQKFIYFTINPVGLHTREEYIQGLDNWFYQIGTVSVDSLQLNTTPQDLNQTSVVVHSTITGLSIGGEITSGIVVFNDTGLIQQVLPLLPPVADSKPTTGTEVDSTGNTVGAENKSTVGQTQEPAQYTSALHAMLIANMSEGQISGSASTEAVTEVKFINSTSLLFQEGVLQNVFTTDSSGKVIKNNETAAIPANFNVLDYARKGFNSNVMADKSLFTSIDSVDFQSLCTGYVAKYDFSEGNTSTTLPGQFPVYIKFGYLLAFLNSMCLLYEAKDKDAAKKSSNIKPYFYIDFHPEYNFCLTSPRQFSVDPYKVLIPFQATKEQYKLLYPDDIATALKDVLFDPQQDNTYSAFIPSFKTSNAYQGKTMNILLNTQYLLEVADQFLKSDSQGAVYFKPFLDKILDDINKSTGGFNLFRVAYRDDSNTVIIKDDQWVPNLSNEPSTLSRASVISDPAFSQLPVFGKGSIVRDMEFKTNMNTKMSAMIAISAQAQISDQVVNSQEATAIGAYNTNFDDAFMKVKLNSVPKPEKGTGADATKKAKEEAINNLRAAEKFNDYVRQVYATGTVAKIQTDPSIAYYLDRLRISKGNDKLTQAAPFIPANLSINIDGISGILMGNAFTIPVSRLPASLRGEDGFSKVGFTVVGLTHTLESNQWTTKIRGQMIKLREVLPNSAGADQVAKLSSSIKNVAVVANASTVDLSYLNLNADWVTIAYAFISSKEGFKATPGVDYTKLRAGYGSDIFLTAPDANNKSQELKVTSSTVFTAADAERTLKYNITGPYANGVISQIGKDNWDRLENNQKAALVSYAYNAGAGQLADRGIARAIKSNLSPDQVAILIRRGPITAGGKVLEGLITRRNEEAQLFASQ